MIYNPAKKMIVFILIHLVFLASCTTTYRTISSERDVLQDELRVGDIVRVLTFEIMELSQTTIKGMNHQVSFDEIVKIEKRGKGADKRAWKMVGGMAFIVAVGVGLLVFAFVSFKKQCEDGSCQQDASFSIANPASHLEVNERVNRQMEDQNEKAQSGQ